jgi:hypothetical protein
VKTEREALLIALDITCFLTMFLGFLLGCIRKDFNFILISAAGLAYIAVKHPIQKK